MLSDSPPDRDMEWSESGVEGSWRFLNKLWKFVRSLPQNISKDKLPSNLSVQSERLLSHLNHSIIEITKSIEEFHFNTAVSSMRSLFNQISNYKITNQDDTNVVIYTTKKFLILINPMVPHIAEELWQFLNNKDLISNEFWPEANLSYLEKDNIKIPIQVNGKVRAVIDVPLNTNEKELKEIALNEKNVLKFLNETPKKVIIIPNRVINFVV